jgi:hypothetical protein
MIIIRFIELAEAALHDLMGGLKTCPGQLVEILKYFLLRLPFPLGFERFRLNRAVFAGRRQGPVVFFALAPRRPGSIFQP